MCRLSACLAAACLVALSVLVAAPRSDARQKDLGPDRDRPLKIEPQKGPPSIWPDLKVGKTGQWLAGRLTLQPAVAEIIDEETMVMSLGGKSFIVKGHPTKDLADDQKIFLLGEWKVTKTEKHRSRTLFVCEPVAPAKK